MCALLDGLFELSHTKKSHFFTRRGDWHSKNHLAPYVESSISESITGIKRARSILKPEFYATSMVRQMARETEHELNRVIYRGSSSNRIVVMSKPCRRPEIQSHSGCAYLIVSPSWIKRVYERDIYKPTGTSVVLWASDPEEINGVLIYDVYYLGAVSKYEVMRGGVAKASWIDRSVLLPTRNREELYKHLMSQLSDQFFQGWDRVEQMNKSA